MLFGKIMDLRNSWKDAESSVGEKKKKNEGKLTAEMGSSQTVMSLLKRRAASSPAEHNSGKKVN